jgi:WD40 repeat protein
MSIRSLTMPPESHPQNNPAGDFSSFELVDMSTALSQAAENTPSNAPRNAKWACTRVLTGHDSWVRSVAVSADGNFVISGSGAAVATWPAIEEKRTK